jgi:hypothetical protein
MGIKSERAVIIREPWAITLTTFIAADPSDALRAYCTELVTAIARVSVFERPGDGVSLSTPVFL